VITPLVSVILPVHDRAAWVGRAIESVLAQTYRHRELWVVDDGSTDDTRRVLARFGSRIEVLEQAHAGAYAARNLGLRHARGELVAFLDSDDAWHPDRLERQLPLLARPQVGLVFGDAVHLHVGVPPARRPRTSFQITRPYRGRVSRHFAWDNFVPTSSVLVRRRCFEELGGFRIHPRLSADYPMWYRIARRYELDYVPEPVFTYSIHPQGISHDLRAALTTRMIHFAALLDETTDPEARRELGHILFNHGVHLALLRWRTGRRGDPVSPGGRRGDAGLARRAWWAGRLAGYQLARQLRRARHARPTAPVAGVPAALDTIPG
jgi:glycosyltransferase involved in cell wall biosynthesis